jgi:hypothetical protein
VNLEARVPVPPDDLTRVVDAEGLGDIVVGAAERVIYVSIAAGIVEEAVSRAARIGIKPDDLADVVDAVCKGTVVGERIVKRSEGAPAIEEG